MGNHTATRARGRSAAGEAGGAAGKAASARATTPSTASPTPREREAAQRARTAESRATAAEKRAAQLERQLAALQAAHDALKAQVEAGRGSALGAKTGEEGGKAAGRGGKAAKAAKAVEEPLRPITTTKDEPGLNRRFDPYQAPDARYLRVLYGDHQLSRALQPYSHEELRETAQRLGVPGGRSKAATISSIVGRITHEPYQETVMKVRRATERMNQDIAPGGKYDAQKDYYAEE